MKKLNVVKWGLGVVDNYSMGVIYFRLDFSVLRCGLEIARLRFE